jgi:hypothetical protein
MSLSDELAAVAPTYSGLNCTVCDYLGTLDKTDAEALTQALANPRYHATMIQRAIANTGCNTVSVGSLRRHRRGECARVRDSG